MSEAGPLRGDSSLAERFTPQMNAATSRFGAVSDIPIAFAVTAVLVVVLVLLHRVVPSLGLAVLGPIAAVPLVACVVVHVALRGARKQVVAWVATVPFPLDNLNAVLSGAGEYFTIQFAAGLPSRESVNTLLETVCPRGFVIDIDEGQRIISARFGIDDSKHNPLGSAYERYERMRELVSGPLSQLHATHPIALLRFL